MCSQVPRRVCYTHDRRGQDIEGVQIVSLIGANKMAQQAHAGARPGIGDQSRLGTARCFKCPDAVLSTLWYPSASLNTPERFCFIASVRDSPVRLVDASDGRVRRLWYAPRNIP